MTDDPKPHVEPSGWRIFVRIAGAKTLVVIALIALILLVVYAGEYAIVLDLSRTRAQQGR